MNSKALRTVLLIATSSVAAGAAVKESPGFIQCKVDGVEIQFTNRITAHWSPDRGITIYALKWNSKFNESLLRIRIPKTEGGLQVLTNTPGLQLIYTRNHYSSNSADDFMISPEVTNSALRVCVDLSKDAAKVVEGTFVGSGPSATNRKTTISDGTFRLKLSDGPDPFLRPPDSLWSDSETNVAAGIRYCTFKSEAINRQVSYLVYLPPSYETDKERRYPVIYWLHGLGGTQRAGAGFVKRLERAIATNSAPESIVVLVNGMANSLYCDSKDGQVPFETVFVKDLVPHIDTTYRTWARREGRALEGHSMGGWGAARLGFKYPDTFGSISALSPAMYSPESMEPRLFYEICDGDEKYFESESAWTWLRKNAEALRNSHIRFWVGEKETAFISANRQYSEEMKRLGIVHEFGIAAGADHNMGKLVTSWNDGGWAFYRTAFSPKPNH